MAVAERLNLSPERAWVATALAATAALAVGAFALPEIVWDRFLWHYFWGPVFADANNAACAVMGPAGPDLAYSASACTEADAVGRIVAEPGYTLVSEAGYAITLIFMLVGVLYLLRYLGVGDDRGLFFSLVPFMFFGGALRVVEDANDAVPQGVEPFISYPWNAFIISPFIYFTVFFLTLGTLVGAVWLDRRDHVGSYETPLLAAGTVLLVVTVGYLAFLGLTEEYVAWYPQMTLATLGGAAVATAAVWFAIERFVPRINAGTGRIGLVVIAGHAVDGVANVLAADWLDALGIPLEYGAKHPINRILIDLTSGLQPAWLSQAIGTSWTFLLVKLLAATGVVWLFDPELFEESPRYAILLLIAILAVGLGPGSRDMLRATFGI